jgi:hypothetical protein
MTTEAAVYATEIGQVEARFFRRKMVEYFRFDESVLEHGT